MAIEPPDPKIARRSLRPSPSRREAGCGFTARRAACRSTAGTRPGRPISSRIPSTQKWTKDAARALDRGFNAIVGARPLDEFVEPAVDRLQSWPEVVQAKRTGKAAYGGQQCAGLDASHIGSGAVERRRSAGHRPMTARSRARVRSQRALIARGDGRPRPGLGSPVTVPRPDDRPTASPARPRRAPRPPRPIA